MMTIKGSYILIIRLSSAQKIKVGSLQERYFPSGYYAYVGSAMGGLKPRLNRHLKKNKKPRWHIDYFTKKASVGTVIISKSLQSTECGIAKALQTQFTSIIGFGSSDCKCPSHLFFAPSEEQLKSGIERAFSLLGYSFKVIQCKDIHRYLDSGLASSKPRSHPIHCVPTSAKVRSLTS